MASRSGNQVRIEAVLDADGVVRGLRQIDGGITRTTDHTERAGKRFSGIVQTAFAFVSVQAAAEFIRAVGRVSQEMFDLGTAAEETASKFKTVFGEAATEVDDFLGHFAALAGLTVTEGREITATLGAMSQGFGMNQDEAGAFSEDVVRLAGDLSSFNNVAIEETLQAIQSGLIGEQEPLRRYGILLSAATVQQRALADTGKTNAKQLTEQEKVLARLSLASEMAGVAIGDLERTQDSTANQARRLSAEWRSMKEELAVGLLPTFGLVLDLLNQLAGGSADALEQVARFIAEGVLEGVGAIADLAISVGALIEDLGILAAHFAGTEAAVIDFTFPIQQLRREIDLVSETITAAARIWLRSWRAFNEGLASAQDAIGVDSSWRRSIAEDMTRTLDALDAAEARAAGRRSGLSDALDSRREELRAWLDGLAETAEAAKERRAEIVATLDDLAAQGRAPGPSSDAFAEKRAELERERTRLAIEAMQDGAAKQLAQIDAEFSARREKLREKYGEEADELIRLLEAVQERARAAVVGTVEGARFDLFPDVDAVADAAARFEEMLSGFDLETLAPAELAEMEKLSAEMQKQIKLEADLIQAKRARTEAAVSAAGAEVSSLQDVLGAALNAVRAEVKALFAKTVAQALASVPFPFNIAIGAAAGAAFELAVPSFRRGVTNFEGGLAQVHQGEMLVNLPAHTNVLTNENTNALLGAISQIPRRKSGARAEGGDMASIVSAVQQMGGRIVQAQREAPPVAFLDDFDRANRSRNHYREIVFREKP